MEYSDIKKGLRGKNGKMGFVNYFLKRWIWKIGNQLTERNK